MGANGGPRREEEAAVTVHEAVAADRLTRLLQERSEPAVGCATGALPAERKQAEEAGTAQEQAIPPLSTPARTSRPRTSCPPKAGEPASPGDSQAPQGDLSSGESRDFGASAGARRRKRKRRTTRTRPAS